MIPLIILFVGNGNSRLSHFRVYSGVVVEKLHQVCMDTTASKIIIWKHWHFKGEKAKLYFWKYRLGNRPKKGLIYQPCHRSILNGLSSQSINKVFYIQFKFTCCILCRCIIKISLRTPTLLLAGSIFIGPKAVLTYLHFYHRHCASCCFVRVN